MALTLADPRPPMPPAQFILRVTKSFDADQIDGSRQAFDLEGFRHLQSFERALAFEGRDFAGYERILDFGCGCGRFMRHLEPLAATTELHGIDIDAEMIEWCTANLPYAQFTVGPHEPPTGFPNGHFDLILNHSVFTHLDERHQDLWLEELRRITRPGGRLLLTVEGLSSWRRLLADSERIGEDISGWREEFETRGILFIRDDHFVGSTHPDFYHSTTHAPWYVMEHWARYFDVLAYLPDGAWTQDLVVLGRRPDDVPVLERDEVRPRITRAAPLGETAAMTNVGQQVRAAARSVLQSARQRDGAAPFGAPTDSRLSREVSMLRAGLYEQGKRMSIITAELQDQVDELKRELAASSGSAASSESE